MSPIATARKKHQTAKQTVEPRCSVATKQPTTGKKTFHTLTTTPRPLLGKQSGYFRSQKLSPRSKLGLLAESQPVHAAPGAARSVPPPFFSPHGPALSILTPPPAATAVPRSPDHLFADLHRGRRVFKGKAPRDVAEVEGPDLEHRSAVGGARRVGADVALEGRARAVQERFVSGHEKLQSLLELIRQLNDFRV